MSSKKTYAPPPPDYSGLIQAQLQQTAVAQQQQQQQTDWAREQFEKTSEISDRVINDAFARQDKLDAQAAEDRARYQSVFQPLEDSLVQEAQDYASPARMEQRAGAAMADVSGQFALARAAAQDRLESFGLDPSQVRAGALDLGTRLEEAKARAGAGNLSREQTAAIGRQLRSEAIQVGRGYPGQSAQSSALAMQGGQLAGSTGFGNVQSGAGTMGTGLQWGALGGQGLTAAGNLMKTGYDQVLDRYKLNQAERNQPSGWGTALGLIGGVGLAGATAPASSALGGLMLGLAEGGAVPEEMSPSGGAVVDDVPAQGPTGAIQLDGGEFVVPEDVLKWKGEEFFQRTITKSREDRAKAPAKPEVRQALAVGSHSSMRAAVGAPPGPIHPQALPLG